jgi:hypothetical protein
VTALTVYAIADARPRGPLGKGLGGEPLAVLRAAGAHVVVERGDAVAPSVETLRAHDRIVRRVARAAPAVLPVRFGTRVTDARALAALLAPLDRALASALGAVRGCEQYTLRVHGRAAPPARPDPRAGPGARFLAKRLATRRAPEIDPITQATRPWVRAARVQRRDARSAARSGDLVATVYHLVARRDARAYRAALTRSAAGVRRVRVAVSGPWPPYAFAELP